MQIASVAVFHQKIVTLLSIAVLGLLIAVVGHYIYVLTKFSVHLALVLDVGVLRYSFYA